MPDRLAARQLPFGPTDTQRPIPARGIRIPSPLDARRFCGTAARLLLFCVWTEMPTGCQTRHASSSELAHEADGGVTVRFTKVPLQIDIPRGWRRVLNTEQWLVYRPAGDGAMVAMSGEKSCALVEKRLYGALIELGLSRVEWTSPVETSEINGLRATVASGTALDGSHASELRYSLAHAAGRQGCLVTLYTVRQTEAQAYRSVADVALRSVRAQ